MLRGAVAAGLCAVALAGCGGGGEASSGDPLVVTPDPSVTAQPATDLNLACTPRLTAVGTVSDVVLAGPCSFDYLGSARCSPSGPGGFTASVQLAVDGGGSLALDVQASGVVALTLTQGGSTISWENRHAAVSVARDQGSATIRPTALTPTGGTAGGGVETVRGVLTCG